MPIALSMGLSSRGKFFFYMFFVPSYILILFVIIIVDYGAGILIERSEGNSRKAYLIVSIVSTCLILFFFKYFDFFAENLNTLADFIHWNYSIKTLEMILPIGLSFHTFQSLSYVIEVYRGKQRAESNFGVYALYVMFFPQLVAGPIERPQHLLPQLHGKHRFDGVRIAEGLKLMTWGMFKKVVVADHLAILVNSVYSDPTSYSGPPLILATVFFAFQIYADFSGYSDIAIGSAHCMGFQLTNNFNRPYASRSVQEFWRRWHISLSTWFRDYVYIPAGGNRGSKLRLWFAISVTFLLSGLWHGAEWTYVVWGVLNGFYVAVSISTKNIRENMRRKIMPLNPKLYSATRLVVTFSLISFSWIFFRAESLNSAFLIIQKIVSGSAQFLVSVLSGSYASIETMLRPFLMGGTKWEFLIACGSIIAMEIVSALERHQIAIHMFSGRKAAIRLLCYACIILAILNFGVAASAQFIYFQF